MRLIRYPVVLILLLTLAACSAATTPLSSEPAPPPVPTTNPTPAPTGNPVPADETSTRIDEQGAVVIEITPLNPGNSTDILEFEVAMNTHSVDLSMNLVDLASLTTDTGITVQAILWDAPGGGHHVSGKLVFPAVVDGKPILEGATKITITILNVDAPARVFEWMVN